VLERYVSHVSARVRALGGDPEAVTPATPASLDRGAGHPAAGRPVREPSPELVEYRGTITELIRDDAGRVHRVRLTGQGGSILLQAPERAIGALAAVAHREQLPLSVFAEAGPERRIRNLVVRA
jgi:hypothetical protein